MEGIKNVLADLKMAPFERTSPLFQIVVTDHRWIRAQKGGILNLNVKPGDIIEKGETIAVNTKPFGTEVSRLQAPHSGLVVGCTTVPMVLPGQAVCHLVQLGARTRVLQKLLSRQELPFE